MPGDVTIKMMGDGWVAETTVQAVAGLRMSFYVTVQGESAEAVTRGLEAVEMIYTAGRVVHWRTLPEVESLKDFSASGITYHIGSVRFSYANVPAKKDLLNT
jgi:hypothetical protein